MDMTQRTYRTELLVHPNQGRTADDLLAEAMSGANADGAGSCEVGTSATHASGVVSLRLTFTAPDDATAMSMARTARNTVAGSADITVLTTGTGRHFRRLDPKAL
jgi:hypothetical protein